MDENQRLSRIEGKLDKLSDAVVALARMEERMVTLFNRMNKYEEKHEELEDKVVDIVNKVSTDGQTLRFAERLFWIAASAGVSYLFWTIR
jgi:hypothetical protein